MVTSYECLLSLISLVSQEEQSVPSTACQRCHTMHHRIVMKTVRREWARGKKGGWVIEVEGMVSERKDGLVREGRGLDERGTILILYLKLYT